MARMARADSASAVMAEQQNTGSSYRANTVFAARMFVLLPTDATAAERLLSLMPSTNDESIVWGNFGLAFCQQESDSDMTTLAKLGAQLPSLLASAVILKPVELPRYVKCALLAVGDPDNDHTVQMEQVCRMKRHDFLLAVGKLDPDERKWFDSRIFDVKKCKAIHLPESDVE
jgi:hypothetical protein